MQNILGPISTGKGESDATPVGRHYFRKRKNIAASGFH